jgi:hypothetical protein
MLEVTVFLLALSQLYHAWCHLRDTTARLHEAEERLKEANERVAYWTAAKARTDAHSEQLDHALAVLKTALGQEWDRP